MFVIHPAVAMLIANDRRQGFFGLARSEQEFYDISSNAVAREVTLAPVHRAWPTLKALIVAIALAAGLFGAGQAVFADEPLAPVPEEIQRGNHSGVVLPLPAEAEADAGEPLAPVPPEILRGNHGDTFAVVEANLPPSSRADYRGVELVVAGQ
jgi:hypothetical protein